MSKWIKSDKFKEFANKKAVEAPEEKDNNFILKWRNPVMGTVEKAKEYRIRLIPDPESEFYLEYHYHYFVIDDQHYFIYCPKTEGMDKYCPWCAVSQMLYKGNKEDKKMAMRYRRMKKYITNAFIVNDPRDDDVDDDYKVSNTVRLYEFPATIEKFIKTEITDKQEGYGMAIYDPENGYDLIIKINAKKPDKAGKVWPDYSTTAFSRKASAIAPTEKEIEKIMGNTINLKEYLETRKLSWTEHEKLLKIEGFWEDIEDEFKRRLCLTEKPIEKPKEEVPFEPDNKPEPKTDPEPTSSDEMSEEDLLNELKNM